MALSENALDITGDAANIAFLNVVVSAALFGALVAQGHSYVSSYWSDRWLLKCTVATVLVLTALMLAFKIDTVYAHALGTALASAPVDVLSLWSVKAQALVGMPIVSIIQSVHAARVWMLRTRALHNRSLPLFISFMVTAGLAARIALIVEVFLEGRSPLAQIKITLRAIMITVFAVTAFTDIAMTVVICYYIRGAKNNLPKSSPMLSRICIWMRVTGGMTCAWSILGLCLLLVSDTRYFTLLIGWSMLYANTFMAMLLARHSLRDGSSVTWSSELPSPVPMSERKQNIFLSPLDSPPRSEYEGSLHFASVEEGDVTK